MENKKIKLTEKAVKAIEGLQHKKGTYQYYTQTLQCLFAMVLHESDEIGMDNLEAMHLLRAIDMMQQDIAAIAGVDSTSGCPIEDDAEHIAAMSDATTDSDEINPAQDAMQ